MKTILIEAEARAAALSGQARALERAAGQAPLAPDWMQSLGGPSVSVIAEVKRRSPSAGAIAPGLDPADHARKYEDGGARAISVLTEERHFGGSLDDLARVRQAVRLPVLRKDFVLHPVQVYETRAAGASAVLIIVRAVPANALRSLVALAHEVGLAALVEVHTRGELGAALAAGARIVGVNNRDLDTFHVDVDGAAGVLRAIPEGILAVAESGIADRAGVEKAASWGADAV
ncbi:MAG TPA: indole-3-glycerol phosphate synthase TrpC, partial [Gemmatimonadales bacterium]